VIAITDIGVFSRDIDVVSIVKALPRRLVTRFLVGCIAFLASRVYYIQEMVAALALFAVFFSCIAVVVLLLIVLERGGEVLLRFFELYAKNLVLQAHARRTLASHGTRI
jgi:hypothetical protein